MKHADNETAAATDSKQNGSAPGERNFSLGELQELYANIPGSFSIMTADGRMIAWNAFMREDIVGGSDEAMREVDGFSTIHPDDRPLMEEYFSDILRNGKEIVGEARILLRGGPHFVWRALHGKRLIVDGEACVMAIGINIDKQKRLAALQAFRLRLQELKDHTGIEALLRIALDEAEQLTGSQSGFCSFTPEEHRLEHIMIWSTGSARLFGSDETEDAHLVLKESPLFNPVIKDQKPLVINDFRAMATESGLPEGHGFIRRLVLVPLMGETGVTALFGIANKRCDYTDEDLQLVRLLAETAWDIIGRKRAEESEKNLQKYFRQFQEEGLVARVATRAVDEFNAMLSVTEENTRHLLDSLPENNPDRNMLETILYATARNMELASQLVSFAEKQPGNPDMLNVNAVIDGMFDMLQNLAPDSVRIEWTLSDDELWARMDPGQLELILMNIFMNACEAIDGSGSITISSGCYHVESTGIRASGTIQTPGDYVRISITDTGCGIAPELRPHIFDPFFTTKGTSSQKGLGLSTVYGLVRQSNGCVEVDTEEGTGTTISISLPRSNGFDIPLQF